MNGKTLASASLDKRKLREQNLRMRNLRTRRILTGGLCTLTLAATAIACISTPLSNQNGETGKAIEEGEAGDLESGTSPRFTPKPKVTPFEEISSMEKGTGPLVVVQCSDASRARFVLDREGGTHVLSGAFVTQSAGTGTARKGFFAEFTHARSDDDSTLAFESLAGKVGTENIEALTFTEVDARTGHITLRYGKTQADFSGCVFNTAALQRMRGQEHLRFTLARR